MKNLIILISLLSSLVSFSQTDINKKINLGKDSIDFDLLNKLVETRINKIRRERGLDTLIVRDDMREGALRNSNNSYKLKEPHCIHSEKGKFGEITMMSNVWYGVTLLDLCDLMIYLWMHSPPHKDILLNKNVKYFGSGCLVRTKLTWENLGSLQNPGKMGYVKRYYIWGTVRFII